MFQLQLPLFSRPVRWLGVAGILSVLVYFSLVTDPPQPPTPSTFWDKYLHFAAYAGLALALAYATATQRDQPYRRATLVIGGTVGLGLLIELAQGTLSYRYFGWGDLFANTFGALLVTIWFVVERRLKYVQARRLITDR
ncbi:VanZ family protein [Natrinema salinisoli]|uniref:VanZ family protein n=1 Tax=Natrinema salinisoli TaxID=2878535 RepID=UPI001CF067B0|nr:VanZ family protein [Natrinema salinisoli]